MNINLTKLKNKILILLILINVLQLSLLTERFPENLFLRISYGLVFFEFAIIGIEIIKKKNFNIKKILLFLLFLFLIVFNIFYHSNGWVYIFSYLFIAMNISPKSISYDYFLGLSLGFFFSFVLSIFSIIPIVQYKNIIFGFSNQNTTGYFLFIILISWLIIKKTRIGLKELLLSVFFILVEFFIFDDSTACVVFIIFLFLFILNNNNNRLSDSHILHMFIISLPFLLLIISLILATGFSNSKFSQLNSLLSNRLYNWSHYLTYYNFHLYPQNIDTIEVNSTIYGLPANVLAFDNAYLFYLLYLGTIQFILILLMISLAIKKTLKNHFYIQTFFIVVLLVFGFTENIAFTVQVSPLLPLSISILNYNREENYAFKL